MVNFSICRKCRHCEGIDDLPTLDETINVMPTVTCGVEGLCAIFINDEPPIKCPYQLEHTLTTQDIPEEVADRLSGGAKS